MRWTRASRCQALTSKVRCGRLPRVKRHVGGLIIEPTRLKPGLTPAPDVMPLRGKATRCGEVTNLSNRASINPSTCRAGPARATARAGPFYDPAPRRRADPASTGSTARRPDAARASDPATALQRRAPAGEIGLA